MLTSDQLVAWAATQAKEIVLRDGTELALSAADRDQTRIEANSTVLGAAIARAIVNAYEAGVRDAKAST